jgi:uncharacterized protein YycO
MITVIFRCSENQNQHEEEFEFEDDATDEEIDKEFVDWVWQEVGDNYGWHKKK